MKDTIKIYLTGVIDALSITSFIVLILFKNEMSQDRYFIKAQEIIEQREVKNEK